MSQILALLIGAAAGAVLALAIYLAVRKVLMKGRKDEIIEQAKIEAEGIKKETSRTENSRRNSQRQRTLKSPLQASGRALSARARSSTPLRQRLPSR